MEEALRNRRDNIFQRMMKKIDIDHTNMLHGEPCWVWNGSTSGEPTDDNNSRGHSYPRMTVNGRSSAVHRIMYTHFFGYIPPKITVDHECKNRKCIQPAHLSAVSHKENIRRRDGKLPRKNSDHGNGIPENLMDEIENLNGETP